MEHKPCELFVLSGDICNKRKRMLYRSLRCVGYEMASIEPHSCAMIDVAWAEWSSIPAVRDLPVPRECGLGRGDAD